MWRTTRDGGRTSVALQVWFVVLAAALALAACAGGGGGGGGGGTDGAPATTPETPTPDSPNVVLGALGGDFMCALSASGRIRCWGVSANGRLGFGPGTPDTGVTQTPAAAWGTANVDVGGTAAMVVTGEAFACAKLTSGDVRCWGITGPWLGWPGTSSDIGANQKPSDIPPVDIGGKATFIAAGLNHVCVLLDTGAVRCWGRGEAGRLGTGTEDDVGDNEAPSAAPAVDFGGGTVVQIVAGSRHTCVLLTAGTVRCWGAAFANGVSDENIGVGFTPAEYYSNNSMTGDVPLGPSAVAKQLAAGHSHTCARLETGEVFCWGDNTLQQLGAASEVTVIQNYDSHPSYVNTSDALATFVGAGWYHTCVVDDAGSVRCWGDGANGKLGQLGNGVISDGTSVVSLGTGTPVAVTGGSDHTCALMADFTARCWGKGAQGQLGYALGSLDMTADDPRNVTLDWNGLSDFALDGILAGAEFTCANGSGGYLTCWGANDHGQLGTGDTRPIGDDELAGNKAGATQVSPNITPGPISGAMTSPVAGGSHACFYRFSSTTALCWGNDEFGQLGDEGNTDVLAPNSITVGASNMNLIGTGDAHTCSYSVTASAIHCWGSNTAAGDSGYGGQLGLGAISDTSVPTEVTAMSSFEGSIVQISAGAAHTCVLLSNASVLCWGSNHYGQLGLASTVKTVGKTGVDDVPNGHYVVRSASLPTADGIVEDGAFAATKLVSRSNTTCASVDMNSVISVWCWGTVAGTSEFAPVEMDFGETGAIIDFALTNDAVYALMDVDGTYKVRRNDGALIPVMFTGTPSHIVAGANHVCVKDSLRTVKCWGSNSTGQLGFNPTVVGSFDEPATFYTNRLGGDGTVRIFAAAP